MWLSEPRETAAGLSVALGSRGRQKAGPDERTRPCDPSGGEGACRAAGERRLRLLEGGGAALPPCSQKLLRSPRKPTRKISKIPFKVLDAPELQDDFYLNLVDWSSLNVLSVGLGTCVYLWSACTSQVAPLRAWGRAWGPRDRAPRPC